MSISVALKEGVSTHSPTSLRYIPSLDGLRAIAVVAVMGYHFAPPQLSGGLLGVDVFFVLSGFLITSLLLNEQRHRGAIDLAAFWGRRARRLFPGLFLMLALVFVLTLWTAPLDQATTRGQGIATLFYVNNWWIIFSDQSYFNQFQSPSPLIHTWSLGVEEQWYLIFPVLLVSLFAWRLRRDSKLCWLLGGLALLSTAWTFSLANGGASLDRLYLGTDTRAQQLLVGATLAALAHVLSTKGHRLLPVGPGVRAVLGVSSMVGLVVAFIFVTDSTRLMAKGGMLLLSLVVALLIAVLIDPKTSPVKALLSSRVFRFVGVISYSLYLFHWPVFVFVTSTSIGVDGFALFLTRIILSFTLAIASYYLLEKPVRNGALKRMFGPQGSLLVAVVAFGVLLVGAFICTPDAAVAVTNQDSAVFRGSGERVYIVGDSVAGNLITNFDPLRNPGIEVGGAVQLGCAVFPVVRQVGDRQDIPLPACLEQEARRGEMIAGSPSEIGVLTLGQWEQFDVYKDGKLLKFGSPDYVSQWLYPHMDTVVTQLKGSSKQVVLFNVPCHRLTDDGHNANAPIVNDDTRVRWLNEQIALYAQTHGNLPVIDFYSWQCGGGGDTEYRNGQLMRFDGLHYTSYGAQQVWDWLSPQLLEIGAKERVTSSPASTPTP